MILVENKIGLFLDFKTYIKNTSKLYDFSSDEIKEINTIIEKGTYIVRKDRKIIRVDKQSDIEAKKGEELLFHIRYNKNDTFMLENPVPYKNTPFTEDNVNNLNNKIWYVLDPSNPNIKSEKENYFLCVNDIIKMGNIKLIVQKIYIKLLEQLKDKEMKEKDKEKQEEKEEKEEKEEINNTYDINSLNKEGGPIFNFEPQPKNYFISTEKAKNEGKECYICHSVECDKDNPIISFCDCNDVHFTCLKEELKKKVTNVENEKKTVKNYYINGCNCKKCNYIYPLKFKIEEIEEPFNLIDIDEPKGCDYIIFESIEYKVYYGYLKLVFVIQLNDEKIKIGRKKENDMIIRDPSISRMHAVLEYDKKKGKIILKNENEKYGTSVLIKKSLKINENKIKLQVGRSIVEANIMKKGEFEKIIDKNTQNPLPRKE